MAQTPGVKPDSPLDIVLRMEKLIQKAKVQLANIEAIENEGRARSEDKRGAEEKTR